MNQMLKFASIVVLATLVSGCFGNQKSEKDIAMVIEKVLKEKPEIIVEALNEYQKREEAKQAEQQKSNLMKHKDKLLQDSHSLIIGNPKGDVTVTAFKDHRCGYCKRSWPVIQELVKRDPNVRVILKEFPVLGPDSELAARFALASSVQDKEKYALYYDKLITHPGPWDRDTLKELAKHVGLDTKKLEEDIAGQFVADAIQDNLNLGKELGISGTPAFVIEEEIIPGAISLEDLLGTVQKHRQE